MKLVLVLWALAGCDDAGSSAPMVYCGGKTCGAGLRCCLAVSSGRTVYSCQADCPHLLTLDCDGPEDCGGSPCCADFTIETTNPPQPICAYVGTLACAAHCNSNDDGGVAGCGGGGTFRACHSAADCAGDPDYPACCDDVEFPPTCVTPYWRDSILGAGGRCY